MWNEQSLQLDVLHTQRKPKSNSENPQKAFNQTEADFL